MTKGSFFDSSIYRISVMMWAICNIYYISVNHEIAPFRYKKVSYYEYDECFY